MINQIFTKVPDVAWDLMDLAEKPLSLIMDDAGFVAPNVIAEDGSLGIRMIKSGVCFELISALNRPMVSTSANFSGEAAPSNFEEIKTEIKTQVDYCFPEVESDKKKANPSKIIKLKENGEISILRK